MIRITACCCVVFLMLAAGCRKVESPADAESGPASDAKVTSGSTGVNQQPELKFRTPPRPLSPKAVTHDWRDFLGPIHNAVSTETPLLKTFGAKGPFIVWEVRKGEGFASPAVVGDRVVLFHRVGDEEVIECLNADTGRRFWKRSYPISYKDRYGIGNGPKCQPISDGELVYTYGVEGNLNCFKLATGETVWKHDIVKEYKLQQNFFGVGATPLLEGGLLIVNVGAGDGKCVVAFDKKTGAPVWSTGNAWGPSYAAPIPANVAGHRRVFVFAGGESSPATGGLLSIDPSTGKVDFAMPWRANVRESVNASPPVVIDDQVFVSECYGPGGILLNLLPDGSYKEAWQSKALRTHFMAAICKDGYLYGVDGHGPQNAPLVCVELASGKEMWRIEPQWEVQEGDNKYNLYPGLASLMLVDGRCLILGEFGHLAWVDLNPKGYKELEHTQLFFARNTWSMPALSRGLLYVCQNEAGFDGTLPRLICYDLRGE